ncbi:MAG: OstA-like protein [Flavobacteriaceae bacterium]|nr:OstA-like protein [Flavobacteriaceae bacterium]
MRNYILLFLLLSITLTSFGQRKKIKLIHADNTFKNEEKYPNAIVLLGNVFVEHEGFTLRCQQALLYPDVNIIQAVGDVFLNQGDTITQSSKYVDYNGNTQKAVSWGKVVLKDPQMTLTTDTLHFNRAEQHLYYRNSATIKDQTNTLKSTIGNYYLINKKFQAVHKVEITSPNNRLVSNHLDYFTNTGKAYLFGSSTIYSKESTVYTEKGFHDTRTKISHAVKNSNIKYKDRVIKADSLYYHQLNGFISATRNLIITDSINKTVIKGGYAEYFERKDSAYVIQKPVAIILAEKDSMYMHGEKMMVVGKSNERKIKAYHKVKIFKSDLQGKCDSIYSNQATGITKMIHKPILWSDGNQVTGDTIYLISNVKTSKLDSLKVINNAFVIQKDSSGYNQIKGKNILGKFIENKLKKIRVNGNGEVINHLRNDEEELVGILKMKCSEIEFELGDNSINFIDFLRKPDGLTYPPSKFPKELELFKGFLWRDKERPKTKDDIFVYDIE